MTEDPLDRVVRLALQLGRANTQLEAVQAVITEHQTTDTQGDAVVPLEPLLRALRTDRPPT